VSIIELASHNARADDDRASLLKRLQYARRQFDLLGWWRLDDWLGSPLWTFYHSRAALLIVPLDLSPRDALDSSLASAAWLRWAAVADGVAGMPCMRAMIADVEARLAAQGVRELCCVVRTSDWLRPYLSDFGYLPADRLFTYELRLCERPECRQRLPMGVSIRQAVADDFGALCVLDALSFDERWHYPPALMEVMRERAFCVAVAVCAGRIVGYACSQVHAWGGHVVRLAVHPEAQRQGIAKALLCDQLSRLARSGARTVSLNTQSTNLAAQQLYQKLGFRRLSEEVRVMCKSLG